jgi:hypothetical protein
MLAPPGPRWTPLVVSAWVDIPPGSFSRVSVSEPSNYEKVDRFKNRHSIVGSALPPVVASR